MKAQTYNAEGKVSGEMELPANLFSAKWNSDLVHQVVSAMRSNQRANTANVKDRSEVRGGGKKPWRQKGTGRARHGSRRSPIWVGGGITHGPTNERNYDKKINRQMKNKALAVILSAKAMDKEVILIDDLKFSNPKTAIARNLLKNLSKNEGLEKINYKIGKRALVVWPGADLNAAKSFSNIKSTVWFKAEDLNPLEAMTYKYVVFVDPQATFEKLTKRLTK